MSVPQSEQRRTAGQRGCEKALFLWKNKVFSGYYGIVSFFKGQRPKRPIGRKRIADDSIKREWELK